MEKRVAISFTNTETFVRFIPCVFYSTPRRRPDAQKMNWDGWFCTRIYCLEVRYILWPRARSTFSKICLQFRRPKIVQPRTVFAHPRHVLFVLLSVVTISTIPSSLKRASAILKRQESGEGHPASFDIDRGVFQCFLVFLWFWYLFLQTLLL